MRVDGERVEEEKGMGSVIHPTWGPPLQLFSRGCAYVCTSNWDSQCSPERVNSVCSQREAVNHAGQRPHVGDVLVSIFNREFAAAEQRSARERSAN